MSKLDDYRLFFREFRRTFQTTGAVLPSGPALCRALAREVERGDGPLRILEVGPGTGAVTARIVQVMRDGDTLDLVELNDQFVRRLGERFETEPAFRRVADRAQIHHCGIEELSVDQPYDVIVSGLPLNNFSVALVEQILAALMVLLRPAGSLSFFEYVAIRNAKAIVSGADQRARLRGIGAALDQLFAQHPAEHQAILPNIPPAWVHRVRKRQ